jgi:hypothetical protein
MSSAGIEHEARRERATMPPMRRAAFVAALLVLGAIGCNSSGSTAPHVVVTIDPNLPDTSTTLFPPVDGTLPALPPIGEMLDADGSDAGASAGDGDACPRTGCTGSCVDLSAVNVSTMVNGCEVWQCCVPADAGVGDAANASVE